MQNKAQFIMSTVRNFRDKVRQLGTQAALSQPLINGPSAEKIKEILNRTGYPLEVTQGQRKYGGPPPDWEGPASGPTGAGHEVRKYVNFTVSSVRWKLFSGFSFFGPPCTLLGVVHEISL